MSRLLRTLIFDRRGVAVVELALTMPILMALVMGVADMSMAYSRKLALEQAVQRAIEMVQQTTEETSVEEVIRSEVSDQASVGADDVGVEYTLFCDGELIGDFNSECADEDALEVRYIKVTVTGEYDPFFPAILGDTNREGNYIIKAVAGIRTK
jgi:hypothetical protein